MIKGVPALPPTRAGAMDFKVPWEVQKPQKNDAKMGEQNGSREPRNQGPEPQSARAGAVETHFRIFWKKLKKSKEMHPFQLPFPLLFYIFFETFREKPKKGSRVRPAPGP